MSKKCNSYSVKDCLSKSCGKKCSKNCSDSLSLVSLGCKSSDSSSGCDSSKSSKSCDNSKYYKSSKNCKSKYIEEDSCSEVSYSHYNPVWEESYQCDSKPSCPKYKECTPVELKCGRREVIVPERTVHPQPVKKCLGKKIITPPAFWVKVKVQPKPIEVDMGDITMCSPPIKLKAWKGTIEGQKIELVPKYMDKHCPAVVLKEHC